MPNGFADSNVLKFSLVCSPQLETDELLPSEKPGRPTLAQFQELWKNWPEVVRKLKFGVKFFFDGGATVVADAKRTSMKQTPDLSSEYWHKLFPSDQFVRPFVFTDYSKRDIYSYPVGNVLGFLKGLYSATAAASPVGFPSKTALWEAGGLSKIHFYPLTQRGALMKGGSTVYHDDIAKLMREGYQHGKRDFRNNAVPPGPPDASLDFWQLSYFHAPHSKPLPPKHYKTKFGATGEILGGYERISDAKLRRPDGTHEQDDIDFHGVISGLGDYPALERELGIVIDLEVEKPAGFIENSLTDGLPAVQVIVEFPAGITAPTQVRCKSVYHAKDPIFLPKPRLLDPEYDLRGLLRLNEILPTQQRVYEIVQMDVDGAGLKLMNMAYNLVQAEAHRTQDTPNFSSLPTMQSAGFSIARTGAALRMAASFQYQTALYASNPNEPTMHAEDLMRGYRMDVFDSRTADWHSLYERNGTYDFKTGTPLLLDDEGYTQLGTRQSADGYTDDLFLHENFVSWQGWSLVAPRPGNAMDNDGISQTPSKLNPQNTYHPNFKPSFKPRPGSLPGLRFGLRYRLRVRSVDLAGNSPSNVPKDYFNSATDMQVYSRFEPVASPPVILQKALNNYTPPSPYTSPVSPGESLERIVIRSYNSDPKTMNLINTPETSSRHFAPPKVGITLTEHHGKLDLPYSVADWEHRSDSDRKSAYADQYATVAKRADGNFDQTKAVNSDPYPPPMNSSQAPPPASSAGGDFPIYKDLILNQLPYLPDPIAAGVTFVDLPGMSPDSMLHLPSIATTPVALDPKVLKESVVQIDFGIGKTWMDITGFRLEIHDATESAKNAPGHSVLPVWSDSDRLLKVYLDKAQVAFIPYSSFLDTSPLKLGDTLPDTTKAAVDAMGLWQWVLTLNLPAGALAELRKFIEQGRAWMFTPSRFLTLVHAVQKPLTEPAFTKLTPVKYLGDTFATLQDKLLLNGPSTGKIDIRADWSEPVDDLHDPTWKLVRGHAQVVEKKIEDPATTWIPIDDAHNFGDTKHRMINYTAVASTRFREYYPTDLTKDETNISVYGLNPAPTNILNSARPTAPDLLYMIPIFGWERPPGNVKGAAHKRHGNALRVYLNRPWFNSGEGEELGVMIWTDEFNKIPDKFTHYVTQWGMDPIWGGKHPSGAARLDSFPRMKHWHQDVTLDEVASQTLYILEHSKIDIGKFLTPSAPVPKQEVKKTGIDISQIAIDHPVKIAPPITRSLQPLVAANRVSDHTKFAVIPNLKAIEFVLKPSLIVVGHEVFFDPVRQLWYSDIEIDTGDSYTPFVRLALTRFQPDSVDNAHVSRVIVADFAQLMPDRNVAVIFDPVNPKLVLLAVSGRTYTNAATGYETGHPQVGSQMEVSVEVERPDITDEGEELRWAPIPDATHQLQSQVGNDAMGVWTAFITLPEPRGARKYRLVFKEFEHFLSDAAEAYNNTITVVAREKLKLTQKRLVFAESIEI